MSSNFVNSRSPSPSPDPDLLTPIAGKKIYDQWEQESTKWYSRFQRFLLMGPSRTLVATYQNSLQEAAQSGLKQAEKALSQGRIHVSGRWKQVAAEFDWFRRANEYDKDMATEERRRSEATVKERRRKALDDEWIHGSLMVETAAEALKHGHKFFERNSKIVRGQVVEHQERDARTGEKVIIRERVDREIVYIEMRASEINRMLVDGGKKRRMAVALDEKLTKEVIVEADAGDVDDFEQIDRELFEMFEALGANKPLPAMYRQLSEAPTETAEPPVVDGFGADELVEDELVKEEEPVASGCMDGPDTDDDDLDS